MKARHLTLTLVALAAAAHGQQLKQLPFPDPPDKFDSGDISVDIILFEKDKDAPQADPAPSPPAADEPRSDPPEAAGQTVAPPAEPVRVRPAPKPAPVDQTAADPQRGVEVNVSSVKGDLGDLDPKSLSVRAPFPAKPLAPAPAGWKLIPSDDPDSTLKRAVEIAPGAQLHLTIRPHLLVPDADSAISFAVVEPGYHQSLQYRQTETVGCLLGESIRRLKDDDARMDQAIRRLEQLLVSLPAPEP